MKWNPVYQRWIDRQKRAHERSLVKITIRLSRAEADAIESLAKIAKISRPKWIERATREVLRKIKDGDQDEPK